ncbi:MAG: hypothetical protein IIC66_07455 [candidate division Zixibacteria bacterium]|nr:hypothetical protein [candidate division Zixibacteria bacterium]
MRQKRPILLLSMNMSLMGEKAANLFEYFGYKSKNYYHAEAKANYQADDQLAYYLDMSGRAEFSGTFNENQIPLYSFQGKFAVHPVMISLYALGNCEIYRQTKKESSRDNLIRVADWLCQFQKADGGWQNPFAMPKFELEAGFLSAITQGKGISVLVRAFLVSKESKYVDAATTALKPFFVDVSNNGVRRQLGDIVFYEEYPAVKNYQVLNGFIYALWGLLDLVRLTDDRQARELWQGGLQSLSQLLPKYDNGYWSLYQIGDGIKNPATIPYHKMHIEQLKVMFEITGNGLFDEYAVKWQGYLDNGFNALKTLPQKILWNLSRGL